MNDKVALLIHFRECVHDMVVFSIEINLLRKQAKEEEKGCV